MRECTRVGLAPSSRPHSKATHWGTVHVGCLAEDVAPASVAECQSPNVTYSIVTRGVCVCMYVYVSMEPNEYATVWL